MDAKMISGSNEHFEQQYLRLPAMVRDALLAEGVDGSREDVAACFASPSHVTEWLSSFTQDQEATDRAYTLLCSVCFPSRLPFFPGAALHQR